MLQNYSDNNPFTPSFGEVPAHLAGRQDIIHSLRRAFESRIRRPEHTLLITGARGSGKTAMLSVAAEDAQRRGWIAVNVMAIDGMLEDIVIQTQRAAQHLVHTEQGVQVAGFGVGDLLHFELSEKTTQENWRSRMSDLLDALGELDVGVVITVDEVQPKLDEMVHLAAVYQLFVREHRKVSLLLAGLPHNISQLLQDKSVSFLRRAQLCRLGRLDDTDVAIALHSSIVEAGRDIAPAALDLAVQAADGFPFMMQLVGYHSWEANPAAEVVDLEDMQAGVHIARKVMHERILAATFQSLSAGDICFLRSMLEDEGQSSIGDIATRMGKTTAYATQYKRRLLEQGVIREYGRGKVAFDLPQAREYIAEHAEELS